MLHQRTYQSSQTFPVLPLDNVLHSIRALIPPSASVYYECNRERIERHAAQLAALDLELATLRKRAFAAGARLMALRQQRHAEEVTP